MFIESSDESNIRDDVHDFFDNYQEDIEKELYRSKVLRKLTLRAVDGEVIPFKAYLLNGELLRFQVKVNIDVDYGRESTIWIESMTNRLCATAWEVDGKCLKNSIYNITEIVEIESDTWVMNT